MKKVAKVVGASKQKMQEGREKMQKFSGGFLDFIREQGVVGLAVGFILGGAVAKIVDSLVKDLVNPLIGLMLGSAGDLKDAVWVLSEAGGVEGEGIVLRWGSFVSVMLDFAVIALVVYIAVKLLGVDRLDRKK